MTISHKCDGSNTNKPSQAKPSQAKQQKVAPCPYFFNSILIVYSNEPPRIAAVRRACNMEIPTLLITGDTAKDLLIEARNSGIPLLNQDTEPPTLSAQ